MVIYARAPVRVDFAGGWTDVALFTQEQLVQSVISGKDFADTNEFNGKIGFAYFLYIGTL